MAIEKDVENEFGVAFNYHKIREVRLINDDKGVQLVLTVYSWANRKARTEGKQPSVRQCVILEADFALAPFYALLKSKFPDFDLGTDELKNGFKKARVKNQVELIEQTGTGKLISRRIENKKTLEEKQ